MKMRISLTADPELPVPPRLYGGIERIVDMLARTPSNRKVFPVSDWVALKVFGSKSKSEMCGLSTSYTYRYTTAPVNRDQRSTSRVHMAARGVRQGRGVVY